MHRKQCVVGLRLHELRPWSNKFQFHKKAHYQSGKEEKYLRIHVQQGYTLVIGR